MNKQIKQQLYHQTPFKILSFLSVQPSRIFSAQEISKQTKSSKGATHQTLKLLLELDILSRTEKGNLFLYKLNPSNFILKQFKIFETLLGVQKLVNQIKAYCYQIILFGSCAEGSNFKESDLDIFIKSEYKNEVRKIISKYETADFKIQAVIQDPLEIASSKKKDKVFFEQVKKGITLWEGKPTYERI